MSHSPGENLSATFIQLEHDARHAENFDALFFLITNSTKKIIPYHQAALWHRSSTGRIKIANVSGIGLVNQDSPYILWLKELLYEQGRRADAQESHRIDRDPIAQSIKRDWDEWAPPHALWCPLRSPRGRLMGGLWLVRQEPWQDHEIVLLNTLCDAYGHAWSALRLRYKQSWWQKIKTPGVRRIILITMAVVVGILLLPLHQTALAPASIVAKDPSVISSPVEGVVAKIYIEPNQAVKQNDELFSLDDTQFVSQFEVAEKALEVAEQRYRKAGQYAFESDESKRQIAIMQAEVNKAQAQLDYARSLLAKIKVTAPRSGIAIFSSKTEWIGKPVTIGEKIMLVADEDQKELDVWLPVNDAIRLQPGSDVTLFLNAAPLSPVDALVKYISYSATERPDGTLAYLVKATFPADQQVPRIGLQGTAKLYGPRVVLAYYLFWRPISVIRRTIGF